MKFLLIAIFMTTGTPPQAIHMQTNDCRASMEQVMKSYGMDKYIKTWSVSSMKADNGTSTLKITCNPVK